MQNTRIATTSLLLLLSFVLTPFLAQAQWNALPSATTQNLYGIHFTTSQKGFATGWDDKSAVILYTSNGGTTWTSTQRVGDYLFGIASTDSLHVTTVGYAGSCGCGLILHSNDGGDHWSQATDGSTLGYYQASFADKLIGFAGGWQGAMASTTDGGENWTNNPVGEGADVFKWVGFASKSVGFAISDSANYSMPHRLWKTTDAGSTWKMIQDFGKQIVIASAAFTDAMNGIVVGSDGQGCVYRTMDGGANWKAVWHGGGPSMVLQGATFSPGGIGYAVGNMGLVVRSTDHAATWKQEQTSTLQSLTSVEAPTDSKTVAAGSNGVMFERDGSSSVAYTIKSGSNYFAIPNPASSQSVITLHCTTHQTQANLTINDLLGRVVKNVVISADASEITIGKFAQGTYLYRISTISGEVETGKLQVL